MPVPAIKFSTGQVTLDSSPINSNWILEGTPVARNKLISRSVDGMATTLMWECTAGRFNWFYDVDETVCVVEGSVTVRDHAGSTRTLFSGDTAFFPAGSSAEWTVETYVRKIAFMRNPLPRSLLLIRRCLGLLKRLFSRRASGNRLPSMAPGMSSTA